MKNFTGHSKGAAVVDKWLKNNPGFQGRARLCNTPYEDITGSEAWKEKFNEARKSREDYYKDKFWGPSWLGDTIRTVEDTRQDALEEVTGLDKVKGMKERHEQRFAQKWDPASILDTSATVTRTRTGGRSRGTASVTTTTTQLSTTQASTKGTR